MHLQLSILENELLIVFGLSTLSSVISPPNEDGGAQNCYTFSFYPTALKGCRGIVFTHGVRMGGWSVGRVKVCPGYISETVRCRKLILGRDIG